MLMEGGGEMGRKAWQVAAVAREGGEKGTVGRSGTPVIFLPWANNPPSPHSSGAALRC